uniref:DUF7666 domain-containing protein n=1 Tax=Pelagimonas sp. TaxID=2073170 RepID=UPI003D6C1736
MTTLTAFKGFNPDWTCRGFQFEVGRTYEHQGEVEACRAGFHACEFPFDVWSYYGPVESKFAVVTLDGDTANESGGDSKIAAGKITIEAELSLPDFIRRSVDWILEQAKDTEQSTGDRSAATNTGYQSAATYTGDQSAATDTGDPS